MSGIPPFFALSYKEKERYPGDTSNIVYVIVIKNPRRDNVKMAITG